MCCPKVKYPSGAVVNYGNLLDPKVLQEVPEVSWPAQGADLYTLMMIDPDAPTRFINFLSPINHWLVINIPGADIANGEILAEYIGPGPPRFTGTHRYTFLVYKQSKRIEPDQNTITKGLSIRRLRTTARGISKKYDLGEPIAANFFLSKHFS